MASKDWWCPNCKQMVKPRENDLLANTLVIIVILPAWYALRKLFIYQFNWLDVGRDLWWVPAIGGLLIGFLAAGSIYSKFVIRSCPICRTEDVKRERPLLSYPREERLALRLPFQCPYCNKPIWGTLADVPEHGNVICPVCHRQFHLDIDPEIISRP